MRRMIAAVAVPAVALILAPAALAQQVTGGKTVLKPDVDTLEGFADMSTSVGATGAARDAVKGVVFPISGGEVGAGPQGTILHRGGLVFAQNFAGGEILKFSRYRVKISASGKAKLFAKSEGSEVRFLDLDINAVVTNGAGTRVTIKRAKATLAKPAAQLMSEAFDFPFRKGIPFGTMNIKAALSS